VVVWIEGGRVEVGKMAGMEWCQFIASELSFWREAPGDNVDKTPLPRVNERAGISDHSWIWFSRGRVVDVG
jgi:hypothetical protein